ncbi:NAD-dependent epimerase/dehydratase family protein, partial [Pseudobutyrivibrio sp.]
MNVLVTGSNGFIGYHVCDYLKEKDFFIIGLGRSEQSKAHTDKYYSCDMCTPEVEEV